MKRYEKYKAINLPWLSEIPIHWALNRNKAFLKESKDVVGESSKDYNLLSLTKSGIIPRDVASGKGKFPSDFSTYKIICPGDMVFCLFDIDETPRTVGLSSHHGMLTGSYDVFHVTAISSKYMLYYYLALDDVKAMRPLYKGLRKTINVDTFLGTKLPVPPRDEQDQIVRYLDWQVSKINRLIAAKRKEVERIAEYRKAKIDDIILHGDGTSAIKNSGIAWLGSIPVTWEVLQLKRICQVNASISEVLKNFQDDDCVAFLPMESVSANGDVDYSITRILHEVKTGYSSFAKNDVVIAKITPCFENGKGACLDNLQTPIGFGTTEFINLRASKRVLPQFLYFITMTRPFRKMGEEVMTGSAGQKRVPLEFVRNFNVGIPPVQAQQKLLVLLKHSLDAIDAYKEKQQEKIRILIDLRTRLISDVVTGQIDVRGIEIPEYSVCDENASIDQETEEDLYEQGDE